MRLVSILAFVGLASGCANDGDAGMFVLNNSAPPAGTVCTFTGAQAQLFTSAGSISAYSTETNAAASGYILSPLIESRITTTSDVQIPQRTIHLEGANITAQVNGNGVKQQYTALFAGSLAPGGTTNVSFEALPVPSIMAFEPSKTDNILVVLTVQIFGTLGGSRIDADPFQYPVTIVGEGKGIVFGVTNLCTVPGSVARTGNACNPFQDGTVDCCLSKSGRLVCPAIAELP